MTSLKRRLDNVLVELNIIREALEKSDGSPCCLRISKEGMVSCDYLGSLPKQEFLKKCEKCRVRIKKILAHFNLEEIKNL